MGPVEVEVVWSNPTVQLVPQGSPEAANVTEDSGIPLTITLGIWAS